MDEKEKFDKYYFEENPLESVTNEIGIVNKFTMFLLGSSIFFIVNRMNKKIITNKIKTSITRYTSRINSIFSFNNVIDKSNETYKLFDKSELHMNSISIITDKENGGDSTGFCDFIPNENKSNFYFLINFSKIFR